jgi:glucan phosphoethanolaminetransferase (alkaline phosphatase superfamily)
MKSFFKNKLIIPLSTFITLLFSVATFAQNQPDIPQPRGPIDFSELNNIIIFIVIPAIIIIAFLIFRKRIFKVKEEQQERLKDKNQSENREK